MAGTNDDSLIKLFDGYKQVKQEESYKLIPAYRDDVQDVENEAVNNMQKKDWNICYLGRIGKPYVKNIIDDLSKLGQKHPEKSIQIVFAGNASEMLNYINKKFENLYNVSLTFLGDLVPIPKKLFTKVDVVIAGSGCAVAAAYSGALTIIPDPINFRANGVFGFDTFQTVYHEQNVQQMGFDEAVERVLSDNVYMGKRANLPKRKTKDDYFDDFFKFVEQSDSRKEYFTDFQKRKESVVLKRSLKYLAKSWLPFTVYAKQWLKKYAIR